MGARDALQPSAVGDDPERGLFGFRQLLITILYQQACVRVRVVAGPGILDRLSLPSLAEGHEGKREEKESAPHYGNNDSSKTPEQQPHSTKNLSTFREARKIHIGAAHRTDTQHQQAARKCVFDVGSRRVQAKPWNFDGLAMAFVRFVGSSCRSNPM